MSIIVERHLGSDPNDPLQRATDDDIQIAAKWFAEVAFSPDMVVAIANDGDGWRVLRIPAAAARAIIVEARGENRESNLIDFVRSLGTKRMDTASMLNEVAEIVGSTAHYKSEAAIRDAADVIETSFKGVGKRKRGRKK